MRVVSSVESLLLDDSWSNGHQATPTTYSSSGTSASGGHTHNVDGGHGHNVTINADGTGAGVSPIDANLPPFVVINYIIRY